jgi:hypothetical protein
MPWYEYRDPDTGDTRLSQTRANRLEFNGKLYKRKFSFHPASVMHQHFNTSTGTVVSSQRQFDDDLKRLSEERTEATGIPHNYVNVDIMDKDALGVTDEGIA